MNQTNWPIGVFTSIDTGLGVDLEVAREIGVATIQVHAPSQSIRTAEFANEFRDRLNSLGIQLTAVFGGFAGESYADIPTTRRTVGLVPRSTRENRLAEMKQISDFARLLQCEVSALHLGFIPDPAADSYATIVGVTRDLCDHCRANQQNLHLETGQETAAGLLNFISDVGRDNLYINFDPANMILYGTGEPIDALRQVGRFVRSVHCKDAKWADKPGEEWGQETKLGDGDVDIRRFLEVLAEIGYTGPLTIEREIPREPAQQKAEIQHAVKLLAALRAEL